MPTLRQKVDSFCKDSGSKVGETDKLRNQVGMLKQELKKVKATHKHQLHLAKAAAKAAAKTKKAKPTPKAKTLKAPRKPKVKQAVTMKPLPAQAEPMMPAPAAPVPAPTLAPGQATGGRQGHLRTLAKTLPMRW
jgi:hypothetical protein